MDILIEREQDLCISWYPGCTFAGIDNNGRATYNTFGVVRKNSDMTLKSLPKVFNLPKHLILTIMFKNKTDIDLYERILKVIRDLERNDHITINTTEPVTIRERSYIKDGYELEVKNIINYNTEISEKFNVLIQQLKDIGCDCSNLYPVLRTIPDEYYQWDEYKDVQNASINIYCYHETCFYKFLQENNLIEKYMPNWYTRGNF